MKTLANFWLLLDSQKKIKFIFIILFSICVACLEALSIAIIIPFATFLFKPDLFENSIFFKKLTNFDILNVGNENLIFFFCICFFLIFLLKNIIIYFTTIFTNNFIYNFKNYLYEKLIRNILHQDYLFFVKNGIHKVINTISSDLDNFIANVTNSLINIVTEFLVIFGIVFLIFYFGYGKSLILLIPMVLLIGIILKYINRYIKFWSEERKKNRENFLLLNFNLFYGIKEILLFGKIKDLIISQKSILKKLSEIDVKDRTITIFPRILLEQSIVLIFVLIIIFMTTEGKNNNDILIILTFYLAAAYRLLPSFNKIFVSYQNLKFGRPSYHHISKYLFLDQKNIFLENIESEESSFENKIQLKNISFQYSKKIKLFNDINLSINKNTILGIHGESGCGKSTLINILTLLIKPNQGDIIIDDKKINTLQDIRSFQNLFCITSQDSFLFNGTVKENIIFGSRKKISEEKIKNAVEFSGLSAFLNKLPNGINTDLGGNIKQVSSGQKQRIAIARAFYSDKSIIIFDEATNALDTQSEQEIFSNLKKLKNKKTIIIISHNKDNLSICDQKLEIINSNLILK